MTRQKISWKKDKVQDLLSEIDNELDTMYEEMEMLKRRRNIIDGKIHTIGSLM